MCTCDSDSELEALLAHRSRNRTSLLGRLDSRTRLAAVGVGLLANLTSPSPLGPLLLAAGALLAAYAEGVPLRVLIRRLVMPTYLAVVVLATQVLLVGSDVVFSLGPVAIHREGLAQGLLLASRVMAGTGLVLALSLSTSPSEFLALAAWLRVPDVLVEIAGLTYRYLFLLLEEAERVREAQVARLGHRTWWRSLGCYSNLIGTVFVRSYDRGQAVYEAMVTRGYRGQLPVGSLASTHPHDWAATTLVGTAIAAAALLGHLVSGG